jgi:hypothetical protein
MSDLEYNNDRQVNDENDEDNVETIDLTENPIYQVLTAFFEDDNGNNLCDILLSIKGAIDNNTRAIMDVGNKLAEFSFDDDEADEADES